MLALLMLILALLLFAYLIYDWWREGRALALRERLLGDLGVPVEGYETGTLTANQRSGMRPQEQANINRLVLPLALLIRKSGLPINLPQFLWMVFSTTTLLTLLAFFLSGFPRLSLGLIALVPIIFLMVLRFLVHRRVQLHNEQLSALTSQFITTLRSGGTPMQAMQSSAENAPSPLRESIAELLYQMQIGVHPVEAWRDWANFWNTQQARMVSLGVRLKWDAGGQMTVMLTHILDTLEFRRRMDIRIQTLTAQARLSVYVLSSLPILIGLMIYYIRPSLYEDTLNDPFGQKVLIGVAIAMLIGFFWLRKIAKLEY